VLYVFISYRRADAAKAAGRIYGRLEAHFGPGRVYRDVDRIPLGTTFKDHIDKAIGQCRVTLVVIGSRWLTITGDSGRRRLDEPDDLVRIEIEWSLQRANRVIPVLVDGAAMPTAAEIPESIRTLVDLNGMPVGPGSRFDRDVDRLIRKLDEGAQRDEAVEAARECLSLCEYDAAAYHLQQVHDDFRDDEVRGLLREAQAKSSEWVRLAAAAAEAADRKQFDVLAETVRQLWALKPDEEAIRQLVGDSFDRVARQ